MARVTIEQAAFTDPRFAVLGQLLEADRWSAISRMAAVWSICTERNTYVLQVVTLNALFDDIENFADAVVKAELGCPHRRGIRICGTRGRVEWLENKRRANRENGKKGGRPKKTHDKPTTNHGGLLAETPLALALAPALEVGEEKKSELTPQRAAVQSVLDGWQRSAPAPAPSNVAGWIATLGGVEAVLAICQRYPAKPEAYIARAVMSAAEENSSNDHRTTGTNRRRTGNQTDAGKGARRAPDFEGLLPRCLGASGDADDAKVSEMRSAAAGKPDDSVRGV